MREAPGSALAPRAAGYRGAVALARRAMGGYPATVPEPIQPAERVDVLSRAQGERFRAEQVKMVGEASPASRPSWRRGGLWRTGAHQRGRRGAFADSHGASPRISSRQRRRAILLAPRPALPDIVS